MVQESSSAPGEVDKNKWINEEAQRIVDFLMEEADDFVGYRVKHEVLLKAILNTPHEFLGNAMRFHVAFAVWRAYVDNNTYYVVVAYDGIIPLRNKIYVVDLNRKRVLYSRSPPYFDDIEDLFYAAENKDKRVLDNKRGR